MDDDKREKLREYLRNNQPKNRINLGNNSNNKENFNKNLENDLNLDNSNLNHSQNSSSKEKPKKRDYDKEPLILKDYTEHMSMHLGLCLIVSFFIFLNFSSFFEEYDYGNINLIFLFVNMLLFIVFLFIDIYLFIFFNSVNRIVVLYNSYAIFYEENKITKEFFLKGKNIGVNSFFHMVKSINFFIIPVLIVLVILESMEKGFLFGFCSLFIFIVSFITIICYDFLFRKIIYKNINGNLNGFYDNWLKLHIEIGWERMSDLVTRRGISLFFFNEKDYKDLKEYIQIVFDKNLDKDIKSVSE